MLSYNGWNHGITSMILVVSGVILGIFFIYKSRKTNAKLLFFYGVSIICIGFGWLGETVDFLTVLLTGKNLDNSSGLQAIISYMWIPIMMFCSFYIPGELLIPDKKWYLIAPVTAMSIIFDIFLFLVPFSSFDFVYPSRPGEDLISHALIVGSPLFILIFTFAILGIIFNGFGILIKGLQSTGIIRKKFLLLSFSYFLFVALTMFDQFHISGIAVFFVRIPIISSFLLAYLALREEPAVSEGSRPKREVIVEKGLFRLIERPAQITEEEVSISKEKKICLVCKGKVLELNFICPKCETFYCYKCYLALSQMENACWVCNAPIDKSKPSKPLKREEQELGIEISKESEKKPKVEISKKD